MDLLLSREVVRFLVEGNPLNYTWSFLPKMYEVLGVAMRLTDATNGPPKIEPWNAGDLFQYFKYGVNMLEADTKNPGVRNRWDDETEKLWQKVRDRITRHNNKGLLFAWVRQRLKKAEKDLVISSRHTSFL